MQTPLGTLPGAVPATDIDAPLVWHYGDPFGEQRAAMRSVGLQDVSNREVIAVTGPDRLGWLHNLTSQQLAEASPPLATQTLVLSPTGHIEHHADLTVTADAVLLRCGPARSAALLAYLTAMVFWSKVTVQPLELAGLRLHGPQRADAVALVSAQALVHEAATWTDILVEPAKVAEVTGTLLASGVHPIGSWAGTALRVADRIPRFGLDTDVRTIPNETPYLASAVHLDKGCYRGQETVARVHNLGRPPRRTVLLNLDGSIERLPETGAAVLSDTGRTVGRVGSVAQHYEDGPIALALVTFALGPGQPLLADGVDAVVDPLDVPPPLRRWERPELPNLRRHL